MPAPYSERIISNREFQWVGGNPAQSALAGMNLVPATGDVFWSPGPTLVGGLTRQALMRSNVFTMVKEAEMNQTKYLGYMADIDHNGKLWWNQFIGVNQRMTRFSDAGAWEGETADLSASGFALDQVANNFAFYAAIDQGYCGCRFIAVSDHAQLVWNVNTFAIGALRYAANPIQNCSMAFHTATNKQYGSIATNQVNRFNPGTLVVDGTLVQGTSYRDFISFGSKLYAAANTTNLVRVINPTTMAQITTIAVNSPVCLQANDSFVFVLSRTAPCSVAIIDPATDTVVQTITGIIGETGGLRNWQMKYMNDPKYLVISNNNNPGSDNVTFIELEPLRRRNRRSGSELWAIIPELKDYL